MSFLVDLGRSQSDEIGKHTRLKIERRKACGFKSHLWHQRMKTKLLVILGPTATGKSDLAIRLAKKFEGEVLSADSRQVYKGMDIGTGKITKKEMRGIPHYLLDVENPKKRFTVAKFVELANNAIEKINEKNKLPIICGGTGFYIQALVDGIILPDVSPDEKLRKKLQKKSCEELMEMLEKLDPIRAKNIDRKNARRIIRAIEISLALGKVPKLKKKNNNFNPLFIGSFLPKEELKEKIKNRLLKRIEIGMIEEAKKLHKNGLSYKRMDELGLEYRYLALYLQRKIPKEEMIDKLEKEIGHFAQRQMTWFKKDKRIKWYNPKDLRKIEREVRKFCGR